MARTVTAFLLILTAQAVLPLASASPDVVATINELRTRGCGRHLPVKPPLRPDPVLDRVAQLLMAGSKLDRALRDAGYRAVRLASIEVEGGDEGVPSTLSRKACKDITEPAYRSVGVAVRANSAWIVLAEPFEPPAAGNADSVGRRVLELVNEARSSARRCGRKRFHAAAPLVSSRILQRVALAHAQDMAARSRLSHEGRDGSTSAERTTRAGYRWRFVGENIAAGQATPEQVVADWIRSARHCANLMDPDYTEMGVAYASVSSSAAGIYWAQLFASPRE